MGLTLPFSKSHDLQAMAHSRFCHKAGSAWTDAFPRQKIPEEIKPGEPEAPGKKTYL